jgi:hypothetical protein
MEGAQITTTFEKLKKKKRKVTRQIMFCAHNSIVKKMLAVFQYASEEITSVAPGNVTS